MRKWALLIALVLCGCVRTPTVTVNGEILVGKYDNGVSVFLGIPFAEPPTGDLRWRAPQPLQTRAERRDATRFAAACTQTMRILDWYRDMAEKFGDSAEYYDDLRVSEDCLYLNVWTPDPDPKAGLPVMVWVHGGSNKSGWAFENNYRGQVLAGQGVVVVTVAYRLGVFGFLSFPELEGQARVANFGLWDLVSALRWVQENAASFGGDAGRVTLFGESSGAENILALMNAEPAKDLFHRGILQSTAGFGLDMPMLEHEMARGADLAAKLGAGSVDELRQVSADELLEVYETGFPNHYHSPVIDGQLIKVSTWTSIQAHDFDSHELIIGTNASEWLDSIDSNASVSDVVAAANSKPRVGGRHALESVADETDPRRAMDRLLTADAMLCPSQTVAASRTASGGKSWMYWFTRVREDAAGEALGAYHGAEYPYIFGVHDSYMTTTPYDMALSETMQRYWINFAATGDPNGVSLPEWPLFERPDPVVMEFGDSVTTVPAPEARMCSAFEAWNREQLN